LFAYQIVLEVGLMMEIAADFQLALVTSQGVSLPVTAGIQGRSAKRVLRSIAGGVQNM